MMQKMSTLDEMWDDLVDRVLLPQGVPIAELARGRQIFLAGAASVIKLCQDAAGTGSIERYGEQVASIYGELAVFIDELPG